MTKKKRLVVIDGKSIFYRGYYSMPNLSLPDGTPTGGVYGFASLAIELIKKLEPDYVAVAWDKRGTNIRKRQEIYPEYKAGRKKAPDDFYAQMPILFELLEAFGWPLYELDDYEADDILGAFAKEASKKDIETCLLTSDLDALQIISPLTKVYALKNGLANIEEFDVSAFEKKYGIGVEQFLDLKSLAGDSSDNIPGAPGIGPKTATELLQKYKTLDNIYDHLDEIKPTIAKKLADGKKLVYMSKEISKIWDDAPVKLDWAVADVNDTDLHKVAEILKRLEFHSLIKRLPKHMSLSEIDTGGLEIKSQSKSMKDIAWPEIINIDGPVVVYINGDELFLSQNDKTVTHNKASSIDQSVWRVLEMATVISYDAKALYHQLAELNVFVKFDNIHDINQAAFLIDPLKRDRSLAGLMGSETLDDPKLNIIAIWGIYYQQLKSFEANPKIAKIAKEFDFPLTYILFKMEHKGIKINSDTLAKMSKELGEEYDDLEKKIYKIVGHEFNIGSPIQLSNVLFTKLQLSTEGIKKGKTGYSTGQKELDKLRGKHPIVELIERTRELAKLKNTYVDALPKLVDKNGRLHTTFNQDIVSSGRLSSTNPNLQNIPVRTDLGKKIRSAFVPEKDNVFISADYSQFEIRLAAVLANDKEMIKNLSGDMDIHTKTASEVYGVPIEEVTKTQRRNAKVINFGVLYGMSPQGLSVATGMDYHEAKKFIEQYFEVRKPIRKYIDDILKQARTAGYVETYFGRRRPTPDVHSSNFMVRSSAERAAANMPIQGTEADLMKLAMIKLDEELGNLGDQILQIHDSILVECPKENASKVKTILKSVMENIAPNMGIKLNVDVSVGEDWGEL